MPSLDGTDEKSSGLNVARMSHQRCTGGAPDREQVLTGLKFLRNELKRLNGDVSSGAGSLGVAPDADGDLVEVPALGVDGEGKVETLVG